MWQPLFLSVRAALVACVCASALACVDSPGPPTKASADQIDQMNQEFGAASSSSFGVAPDWPAIMKAIRAATDSVERRHHIAEFAHHVAALPESLRTQRLSELNQLMREAR